MCFIMGILESFVGELDITMQLYYPNTRVSIH